jgi:hypothetical protein
VQKENMLKQIFIKSLEQTKMFLSWDKRLAITAVAYVVTTFFGRWQILGKGVAVQYLGEIAVDLLSRGILFAFALYIVNLIRAPFLIIKEQSASIATLTKNQDREKVIIRLRELRRIGVELRNRGQSLLHENSINNWWQEHLSWREETANVIELLDKEQAERWKTLDKYIPQNPYPKALTPQHRHRLQMFDEWLQRLDSVTNKLKEA